MSAQKESGANLTVYVSDRFDLPKRQVSTMASLFEVRPIYFTPTKRGLSDSFLTVSKL